MPDGLTPEERAMIDDAVKAGGVQQIERGKSAYEMRYDPSKRMIVYVSESKPEWGGAAKRNGIARAAARRLQVSELIDKGLCAAEIAAEMRVSMGCIYEDAKRLQKKIRRPKRPRKEAESSQANTEWHERRAAIVAAYSPDKTLRDIEHETGINRTTVRDHLDALGWKPKRGKPGKNPYSAAALAIKERRVKVRAMIADGLTAQEVAEKLGVSTSTVWNDNSRGDVD